MSLYHLEDGVMVDRTSSRDSATNMICARVTSLSPFVIASDGSTGGGCSIAKGNAPFDPMLIALAMGAGGILWWRRRERNDSAR